MSLTSRRAALAPVRAVALGFACAVVLAGCGAQAPSPAATGGATQAAAPAEITVFAAASLTEVFDTLGPEFEKAHGARVSFSYAGSSDLAAQLGQGAPGAVFASADEEQMRTAVENGSVAGEGARVFATNTLTAVTPSGNPAGLTSLAALAGPGVKTVVCAPQVPCGATTQQLEQAAGIDIEPVSEEQSVTDVLGKVTSGQADAGIVYVTDAKRAKGRVEIVDIPEATALVNRYPIAVTEFGAAEPGRRATAEAFVAYVLGERGRAVLQDAGFGRP